MDYKDLQPYFPNPANESNNIKVILDICHMVKLIRNVLASKQMFYNAKNEPIKWAYITQLEIVQTEEGTLANKLRSRHVQYGGGKK